MSYCDADLYWELELVIKLGDELIVSESLPHLHDADDRSVHLVLTILKHSLGRTHVLFLLCIYTDKQGV